MSSAWPVQNDSERFRMKNFSVSEMFADHLVLCHDRENPVWGNAPAGAEVRVRLLCGSAVPRFGGRKGEENRGEDFPRAEDAPAAKECGVLAQAGAAADENGCWCIALPTPGPGKGYELEVCCGGQRVLFRDVAVGEVWLAGGQSNMEMPVMCIEGGRELACADCFPDVRLRTIPRVCQDVPQHGWHFQPIRKGDSGWLLPSRDHVARFSAIGYQFAALLSRTLGMTVGIIDCSWGGTRIQSWLPEASINAHEDTRGDAADFERLRASLGEDPGESFRRYQASLEKLIADTPDMVERSLENMMYYTKLERVIDYPAEGALGDPNRPGCLYTHMVARTAPYGIRGVLWYQGESNALVGEADRYAVLFGRLLESWRTAWHCELPFLTCQLSVFDPFRWGDGYDWVTLRARQAFCADTMPGVSMAVLADVGEEKDIHPHRKIPVGRRLYQLALRDVYGLPAGDVFPPRPVSCAKRGDSLQVSFDAPIELRSGDVPYAVLSGTPVPCQTCQTDDCTLAVRAGDADGVWYGQSEWFNASLFGKNGEPVAPFRIEAG